ncbi:hypothetical protein [Brevundimonas sp. PAMC22021]|uniref:hypothetical protein n=1 Tax=Brevundimonas sp. PAMC22021 TaxID=2861285 RepID=UPI001C63458E|nr:hypothetical protein [Brevundimonas sp. PAMC22021]QYF87237.1 hypothetical protein KY493_01605 [Brevundimonas sp. PAMC22021]
MMPGYVGDRPAFAPRPGYRHYEVESRNGGWCVVMNGCRTRPLPCRRAAMRLARTLQAQADCLNHKPEARQ